MDKYERERRDALETMKSLPTITLHDGKNHPGIRHTETPNAVVRKFEEVKATIAEAPGKFKSKIATAVNPPINVTAELDGDVVSVVTKKGKRELHREEYSAYTAAAGEIMSGTNPENIPTGFFDRTFAGLDLLPDDVFDRIVEKVSKIKY